MGKAPYRALAWLFRVSQRCLETTLRVDNLSERGVDGLSQGGRPEDGGRLLGDISVHFYRCLSHDHQDIRKLVPQAIDLRRTECQRGARRLTWCPTGRPPGAR